MSASVEIDYRGDRVRWTRIQDPDQDYPVDYHMAVLGCDPERDTIDLLVKWEPDSYCHFHRHAAATTVLVLQGEQHVAEFDDDGREVGRKSRRAGEYARRPAGEAHMEWAGPEGAVVFFSLQALEKGGPIFETLDREMKVVSSASAADLVEALGLDTA
jgi:hypothetical protein